MEALALPPPWKINKYSVSAVNIKGMGEVLGSTVSKIRTKCAFVHAWFRNPNSKSNDINDFHFPRLQC